MNRIALVCQLLAADPGGFGGVWLRARSGPVRDRVLAALGSIPLPSRRLHPSITDEQLYGGIDLSATLAGGRLQRTAGLLAEPAALFLPMAERCSPGLAARLSGVLDRAKGHCLIALDEGAEPQEALPETLADRLAFHLDLNDVALGDLPDIQVSHSDPVASVAASTSDLEKLTVVAARLGIASLRAPMLALRVAQANAALNQRKMLDEADLAVAGELVLAPRATQLPEDTEGPPAPPEPDSSDRPESEGESAAGDDLQLPQDMVLEAALAALPPDVLAQLAKGGKLRMSTGGNGTGAKQKSNRRGRPVSSKPGRLDGNSRIDLIATLRAAAPWQPIRRKHAQVDQALHIRASDIRVKRYEEKSDRLLIFTVDASGSAAMARLAEAKGAVELLLAEAYARRDHVALVGFRGEGAELLLPPTRSLVQTKRRLAEMPGGGGTPLAAGLMAALELALLAKGRGMTPTIALLTDGRANIALDGTAGRAQAGEDAEKIALSLRGQGMPALVIDTGKRPAQALSQLAKTLDAPYIPLPRADAQRLSQAVSAALEE